MSHIENDKYLEELQEAEEEFNDAKKSYENAVEELIEASRWLTNREDKFRTATFKLNELKEKDL